MKTTPIIITIILVAIGLCIFYWQYDETRRYNAARKHLLRHFDLKEEVTTNAKRN